VKVFNMKKLHFNEFEPIKVTNFDKLKSISGGETLNQSGSGTTASGGSTRDFRNDSNTRAWCDVPDDTVPTSH
jgi:hypothetical protein